MQQNIPTRIWDYEITKKDKTISEIADLLEMPEEQTQEIIQKHNNKK